MFEALVFAVLHCGFQPRSAAEAPGSGKQRFERIIELIRECPLGIHDLSRTEPSGRRDLPRFNMPFELGLYVGAREFGDSTQQDKDYLVFERRRHDCDACCSDLGGTDPLAHGNKPRRAIQHVRDWLNSHSKRGVPGPAAIGRDYSSFRRDLPRVLASWALRGTEVTFVDFRKAATEWLREARRVAAQ